MDELRIGDAEREQALALLGEQFALGRISKDELDERSDAVWSARTRGDLRPVFADLPVRTPGGSARAPALRGPWSRVPLLPLLLVLVGLTVLTHLPLVLLGLALWLVVGRRHRWRHERWQEPWRGRPPRSQMRGRRFEARGSWS